MFTLVAFEGVQAVGKQPRRDDLVVSPRNAGIAYRRNIDEGERELELLRQRGDAASEDGVGRAAEVGRELDVDAQAEKRALAGPELLIGCFRRVIGADVSPIGHVASAFRPEGGNQESLVMEAHERTKQTRSCLAGRDTAVRSENGRGHFPVAFDVRMFGQH